MAGRSLRAECREGKAIVGERERRQPVYRVEKRRKGFGRYWEVTRDGCPVTGPTLNIAEAYLWLVEEMAEAGS